jgi:PAS domain S-box-containing protein
MTTPTVLRQFPNTATTLALAVLVTIAAVFWGIDVFELPWFNIVAIEHSEAGEIAIAFLLIVPAFLIDRVMGRLRTNETQRVRFALAAARMGVWEWDLRSDVVTWSDTTALAFGLSREQAPKSGREFFALVHPDDRQALTEASQRAIRERTDLDAEFRAISDDGVVRWVHAHGRVAYEVDGRPTRILGVNIDISQRKSLEDQLLEADRQADRLRVLQMTMRTVQDIVNNNLNQLQMLRLEADGYVSSDTLKHFDKTIQDTAVQLTALGNMTVFAETPMASGPGLDVRSSTN